MTPNLTRRLASDLKKYGEFIGYSVLFQLKINTAGTYLGLLWWFLEPLFSMLIYVFCVRVIFRRGGADFPVYVFCGTLAWAWVVASVVKSTTAITSRRRILQTHYIPKFILPLINTITDGFYFLVGAPLIVMVGLFFQVQPTLHLLEFPFVVLSQFFLLYAASLVGCHIGVYFKDIGNILTFAMRLLFYLSPGMYMLDWIPENIRWLWWLNPLTAYFTSYRDVILYGKSPEYAWLAGWFALSCVVILFMTGLMYRHDKNYTKVI